MQTQHWFRTTTNTTTNYANLTNEEYEQDISITTRRFHVLWHRRSHERLFSRQLRWC